MHRVIAISDLHLGGDDPPMLGHPQTLAGFLDCLATHPRRPGESLELVIHGDFVDFLAERPWSAWTVDEQDAIEKLDRIFARLEQIERALARCLQRVDRFTVLLGNHDVELALPRVRDALYRHLATGPHRCAFLYNNEAYRHGQLLIEHGNRYDTWNRIDHDGLRQTVSALSRGETPEKDWLAPCPGSKLVVSAMNPLKQEPYFHFIDLLKPEGMLLALLLRHIAPSTTRLIPHFLKFAQLSTDRFLQRNLPRRGGRQFIASGDSPASDLPSDVASDDREDLLRYTNQSKPIQLDDPVPSIPVGGDDRPQLDTEGPLAAAALRKLQRKLRHMLCNDRTFNEQEPGEPGTSVRACYDGAEAILRRGAARVVVMGHTHLKRDIMFPGGRYVNTGTWADLIRMDEAALSDSEEGRQALNRWWGRLVSNHPDVRFHEPTFADVRLTDDGNIVEDGRPMLRTFNGRGLDEP